MNRIIIVLRCVFISDVSWRCIVSRKSKQNDPNLWRRGKIQNALCKHACTAEHAYDYIFRLSVNNKYCNDCLFELCLNELMQ